MEFKELMKMKVSRKKPKEGDIFVVQPEIGKYFYGKVIRINLPSKNIIIKGWNLIYIYSNGTRELVLPEKLNPENLLFPPQIVNNQGWLKGYFFTIGNIPLISEDILNDYGFLKEIHSLPENQKFFVDEEGNKINKTPKFWTYFGLGSYGVIGRNIKKEIEKNPELINF